MKPKTVGRELCGQTPPLRTEIAHVGLVSGTIVLTSDGEIPVEYLSPGDRIITRNAGFVTLQAVEMERVTGEAVKIAAGSLGDTKPTHHVMLPAAQMVLVRDWRAQALRGASQAVMPAGCLIDDEFITSLGLRDMTLLRLGFEAPHVIYADGLELSVPAMVQTASVAA
ncbi:Hint domain-containing protein [uncultured Tateyamaria sp.]|uniref:Hint domain-containing protein n=1 Tax=uncultured Tateyamaria sp. TaxID=455651 RepID=UPI002635B9DF|nr:Hint domain-containing protein [uncultured Tateyamaria sp.]